MAEDSKLAWKTKSQITRFASRLTEPYSRVTTSGLRVLEGVAGDYSLISPHHEPRRNWAKQV